MRIKHAFYVRESICIILYTFLMVQQCMFGVFGNLVVLIEISNQFIRV